MGRRDFLLFLSLKEFIEDTVWEPHLGFPANSAGDTVPFHSPANSGTRWPYASRITLASVLTAKLPGKCPSRRSLSHSGGLSEASSTAAQYFASTDMYRPQATQTHTLLGSRCTSLTPMPCCKGEKIGIGVGEARKGRQWDLSNLNCLKWLDIFAPQFSYP